MIAPARNVGINGLREQALCQKFARNVNHMHGEKAASLELEHHET